MRAKVSPNFQKAKEAFATYSSFVDQMLLKATEVKVTGDAMFDAANSSIDGFVALSNAAYDVMYAEVEKRASQQAMTRNLTVLTVALTIGLALALSWLITRALAGPMSRAISVFGAISSGQYNNQINTSGADEVAQVLRALDDMQGKLRAQIEAERAQAEENARVRAALDNVSSNVMVADPNFKIIYTNPAVRAMLNEAEGDIRKDLPQFSSANVMGSSVDVLSKNPTADRRVYQDLRGANTSEVTLGRRTFKVVANPVTDSHGARAGTVFEWTDRTQEVGVEGEMQSMLSVGARGRPRASHRHRRQAGLLQGHERGRQPPRRQHDGRGPSREGCRERGVSRC